MVHLIQINALTDDQRNQAIIKTSKSGSDLQAGAFQDNLELDYAGSSPTRAHIHSMIRTPNGNDYGKDLLRQHL